MSFENKCYKTWYLRRPCWNQSSWFSSGLLPCVAAEPGSKADERRTWARSCFSVSHNSALTWVRRYTHTDTHSPDGGFRKRKTTSFLLGEKNVQTHTNSVTFHQITEPPSADSRCTGTHGDQHTHIQGDTKSHTIPLPTPNLNYLQTASLPALKMPCYSSFVWVQSCFLFFFFFNLLSLPSTRHTDALEQRHDPCFTLIVLKGNCNCGWHCPVGV